MRTLLLIITILCCGHLLSAQDEVVVVHITGKGSYFAPGKSSAQSIYPGMRMAVGGKLRCQSGGSVKLLYKSQTVVFSDGKTRSLSELDQLVKGGGKPGFMSRFWNFLSGSMQQTQDEKKLEEHHRRYMEEVYAGIKGFADPVYAIRSGLLYGNKLGGGPVTFRWSGGGDNEALRLVVRGKGNVPVYSALVRGKACTIDLSQLALDGGTTGTWQLWPASDSIPKAYSPAVEFVYDPEGAQKSLAALLPDPDYHHAFPAEQLLMQAYVLEQAGFYYDAAQKYEAAAAGNPQNALLRNARAAFLARMDMLEEAKSAMRE